jgi:hypothetical protein
MEMNGMFGKYWPQILFIRYNEKQNGSNKISSQRLRYMGGYYQFDRFIESLVRSPLPLFVTSREQFAKYEDLQLTPFGKWFADVMWKAADIMLKADKSKTLTETLDERSKALKMTIDEINQIAAEEKEPDGTHEKILEMNDKISLGNPLPNPKP